MKSFNKWNNRFCIASSLVVSILVCLIISACDKPTSIPAHPKSSVYDKVITTGKIRAAYVVYPPLCIKDPNSGELSGIGIEAMNQAAKNLDLKLEWTEEVGWGSMIEGLKSGRYDIIGSGIWSNTARGKLVAFSTPFYYSGICVYVRAEENKFKDNLSLLNSKETKISTIDGETADFIARSRYPIATKISLPQLSDISQVLLNVVNKKADVAFVEPYVANEFLKAHPNTLKNITAKNPIAAYGNCVVLPMEDTKLRLMLNVAIEEVINAGVIDNLVSKYEKTPGSLYRTARPYREDSRP